jgi:hypothetical protein
MSAPAGWQPSGVPQSGEDARLGIDFQATMMHIMNENEPLSESSTMKSVSVHGIDKETEKAIQERAKAEGRSVNKVVKELIAKSLGLGDSRKGEDRRADFSDLCGVWTAEEAATFLELEGDLETIDPKDWK